MLYQVLFPSNSIGLASGIDEVVIGEQPYFVQSKIVAFNSERPFANKNQGKLCFVCLTMADNSVFDSYIPKKDRRQALGLSNIKVMT